MAALIVLSVTLSVASWIIYDKQAAEIAGLKADIKRLEAGYSRKKDELKTIVCDLRDQAETVGTILDHPDGDVTFVDLRARRGPCEHQPGHGPPVHR